MSISRIHDHLAIGPGRDALVNTPQAKGSWRGHTLSLASAATAQGLVRQQAEAAAHALPMVPVRDIASRRVAAEPAFRRVPVADMFMRARTVGVDVLRVRAGARDLLRGGVNPAAAAGRGGRAGAIARYMSLQLAAAALEDDTSAEAATALLTPVRSDKHTAQDLSEMLRHAANEQDEFQRMVEDILAGLDITPEDGERLADELRSARNDDAKLMELLRKTQGIPQLHREQDRTEREALRLRLQDEIREFERSNDGAMVLANFNAAPVAATTAEPASFLDTYTELVTVPRTFAAAFKLLLTRHAFDALDGVLDNLKKALADDLGAATPSHDTRRLGAVLADLGHMAMSSSLVDRVKDLLRLVRRAEASKRGEARSTERGSRNGTGT